MGGQAGRRDETGQDEDLLGKSGGQDWTLSILVRAMLVWEVGEDHLILGSPPHRDETWIF